MERSSHSKPPGLCLRGGQCWTIKVNAAIPGYTATDLNGHTGYRTASQAAEVTVILATLPDDGPTGTFWGSLSTGSDPNAYAVSPW